MRKSRRVLVTRPEPGAGRTADALRKAGFVPVLFPLTEIEALTVDEDAVSAARAATAIAATSINAVGQAPQPLVDVLAGKPLFAVGDATAEAARNRGFADVRSADGDAAALARLIGTDTGRGAIIVCLCGRVRTGDLETELEKAGRRCAIIETYDVNKVSCITDKWLKCADSDPIDAVLIHSAAAAAAFNRLSAGAQSAQGLDKAAIVAISPRVARVLRTGSSTPVLHPEAPRDDAMIAILVEIGDTQ